MAIKEKKIDADKLANASSAHNDDNTGGQNDRPRKWRTKHQDEDSKNREDVLWELEDTTRNLESLLGE